MTDAAIRAFCLFGRLKFGGDLGSIAKLLPQREQSRARAILRGIEQSPAEEIHRSLLEILKAEEQSMEAYEQP